MTRLAQHPVFENELTPIIDGFLRTFRVASLLKSTGAYKRSGISVIYIFSKLFTLAFSDKSLFMSLRGEKVDIAKDTFYRFLNSSRINYFISFVISASDKPVTSAITETSIFRASIFLYFIVLQPFNPMGLHAPCLAIHGDSNQRGLARPKAVGVAFFTNLRHGVIRLQGYYTVKRVGNQTLGRRTYSSPPQRCHAIIFVP